MDIHEALNLKTPDIFLQSGESLLRKSLESATIESLMMNPTHPHVDTALRDPENPNIVRTLTIEASPKGPCITDYRRVQSPNKAITATATFCHSTEDQLSRSLPEPTGSTIIISPEEVHSPTDANVHIRIAHPKKEEIIELSRSTFGLFAYISHPCLVSDGTAQNEHRLATPKEAVLFNTYSRALGLADPTLQNLLPTTLANG